MSGGIYDESGEMTKPFHIMHYLKVATPHSDHQKLNSVLSLIHEDTPWKIHLRSDEPINIKSNLDTVVLTNSVKEQFYKVLIDNNKGICRMLGNHLDSDCSAPVIQHIKHGLKFWVNPIHCVNHHEGCGLRIATPNIMHTDKYTIHSNYFKDIEHTFKKVLDEMHPEYKGGVVTSVRRWYLVMMLLSSTTAEQNHKRLVNEKHGIYMIQLLLVHLRGDGVCLGKYVIAHFKIYKRLLSKEKKKTMY